jgi:hypothetical protein
MLCSTQAWAEVDAKLVEQPSAAVDLLLDDGSAARPSDSSMPAVQPTEEASSNQQTMPAQREAAPVRKLPPGVFKIPGAGVNAPATTSGMAGHSLDGIARRMYGVAERIAGPTEQQKVVGLEQQHIVRDLDVLIEALNKACKAGGGKPSSGNRSGNKPGSQQASKPSQKPGNGKPATGSGQPQGASGAEGRPVEAPLTELERQRLVDQVWGHLPAAARKQMQQSAGERYHPKYEREIEAYFRRLAEPRAKP